MFTAYYFRLGLYRTQNQYIRDVYCLLFQTGFVPYAEPVYQRCLLLTISDWVCTVRRTSISEMFTAYYFRLGLYRTQNQYIRDVYCLLFQTGFVPYAEPVYQRCLLLTISDWVCTVRRTSISEMFTAYFFRLGLYRTQNQYIRDVYCLLFQTGFLPYAEPVYQRCLLLTISDWVCTVRRTSISEMFTAYYFRLGLYRTQNQYIRDVYCLLFQTGFVPYAEPVYQRCLLLTISDWVCTVRRTSISEMFAAYYFRLGLYRTQNQYIRDVYRLLFQTGFVPYAEPVYQRCLLLTISDWVCTVRRTSLSEMFTAYYFRLGLYRTQNQYIRDVYCLLFQTGFVPYAEPVYQRCLLLTISDWVCTVRRTSISEMFTAYYFRLGLYRTQNQYIRDVYCLLFQTGFVPYAEPVYQRCLLLTISDWVCTVRRTSISEMFTAYYFRLGLYRTQNQYIRDVYCLLFQTGFVPYAEPVYQRCLLLTISDWVCTVRRTSISEMFTAYYFRLGLYRTQNQYIRDVYCLLFQTGFVPYAEPVYQRCLLLTISDWVCTVRRTSLSEMFTAYYFRLGLYRTQNQYIRDVYCLLFQTGFVPYAEPVYQRCLLLTISDWVCTVRRTSISEMFTAYYFRLGLYRTQNQYIRDVYCLLFQTGFVPYAEPVYQRCLLLTISDWVCTVRRTSISEMFTAYYFRLGLYRTQNQYIRDVYCLLFQTGFVPYAEPVYQRCLLLTISDWVCTVRRTSISEMFTAYYFRLGLYRTQNQYIRDVYCLLFQTGFVPYAEPVYQRCLLLTISDWVCTVRRTSISEMFTAYYFRLGLYRTQNQYIRDVYCLLFQTGFVPYAEPVYQRCLLLIERTLTAALVSGSFTSYLYFIFRYLYYTH